MALNNIERMCYTSSEFSMEKIFEFYNQTPTENLAINIERFYDTTGQVSIEKIIEFYINSNSENINIMNLLQYSYIDPEYQTISPYDMEIDTTEKQIHNEQYSYDTDQEENMDTFDENDYIITHDVFMGYPEADKTQFTMNEYFYNNNNTL